MSCCERQQALNVPARNNGGVLALQCMNMCVLLMHTSAESRRILLEVIKAYNGACLHPRQPNVSHHEHDRACWLTQTSAKLYLVLDFMNGGHLFFNLYRQGIFDEPQVIVFCKTADLPLTWT